MQGNGSPGITIGDWLVDQGLDAPKAPRIRSGVGTIRTQQRHSVAVRSASALPVPRTPVSSAGASKQVRACAYGKVLGGTDVLTMCQTVLINR